MAWVARLAVRRVVWIVVGLVVFAALGAAGVRATSHYVTVPAGTYGIDGTTPLASFAVDDGGYTYVEVDYQSMNGVGGGTFWGSLLCGGVTYNLGTVVEDLPGLKQWDYYWPEDGPPSSMTCDLVFVPDFSTTATMATVGATGNSYSDPPAPPPAPTPTPEPSVVLVALVAEDRARLDALDVSMQSGLFAGTAAVFLLAVVAVVTGLRR